jgi:CPA2 family monovalent cation:H+ antiporter-2
VKLLVLDCALLVVLVVGTSLSIDRVGAVAVREVGLSPTVARAAALAAALLLAMPLVFGVFNLTQRLGLTLGQPSAKEVKAVDLAATPRRALVITLQLAIFMVVGLPIVALMRPYFPNWLEAVFLVLAAAVLGLAFWRSATNLEGHVKAGAQLIVEALATQAKEEPQGTDDPLARIQHLMPGLGAPATVKLLAESIAVGKSLAELDLRSRTGASILAIARGKESVLIPTAGEKLRAGDVLALAGTRPAVAAASRLLQQTSAGAPDGHDLRTSAEEWPAPSPRESVGRGLK